MEASVVIVHISVVEQANKTWDKFSLRLRKPPWVTDCSCIVKMGRPKSLAQLLRFYGTLLRSVENFREIGSESGTGRTVHYWWERLQEPKKTGSSRSIVCEKSCTHLIMCKILNLCARYWIYIWALCGTECSCNCHKTNHCAQTGKYPHTNSQVFHLCDMFVSPTKIEKIMTLPC